MTIAIIGARGDMGKNLLVPLLSKIGTVLSVNSDSDESVWQKAWQSDIIWLSIPREAVDGVMATKKLESRQLVVDICSIKRNLSKIIYASGASHLSLHPLHGPFVPLSGQKWAIINTSQKIDTHPLASALINFLKDEGIQFIKAESEAEHDTMMGITLSLPEMFTVVLDMMIEFYTKNLQTPQPSIAKLMEWAVPASNALFGSYIHSINSSADWLRRDLIIGSHGPLVQSVKEGGAAIASLTETEIKERLTRQRQLVESLPLEERKRIRQWIERWFVDSTQKIFSFHKKKPLKPKLTIQDCAPAEKVFPAQQGSVRVGIHGIAGSFTHESAMRLAAELGVSLPHLTFHYLVEAKRVIEAVTKGEVDRGIFAIANSGSGAYVSSLHAMSENNFQILAIYGMEIMQCLIAHPSIKSVNDIKEVFGHPQAVSQCKRTFAEKYPEIKLVSGQDSDDTALCVERISEGQLPNTTATLASQVAAGLYGANILEYGMHHDPFNTTTFLVIKKKE